MSDTDGATLVSPDPLYHTPANRGSHPLSPNHTDPELGHRSQTLWVREFGEGEQEEKEAETEIVPFVTPPSINRTSHRLAEENLHLESMLILLFFQNI